MNTVQQVVDVKFTKLAEEAVIPQYAKEGDVGLDLTATSKWFDDYGNVCYGTGLAIELPNGYYADLAPRSSVSKYDLILANSIGKIDTGYRGELIVKFKPSLKLKNHEFAVNTKIGSIPHIQEEYEVGDRVAQLIVLPFPKVNIIVVDELSESERGAGGFGSSGK